MTYCEPVWPSGKAGKQNGLGSIPLRLSLLFRKAVVCAHCLVTVSLTTDETLKWLSFHDHRNPGVILVVIVQR